MVIRLKTPSESDLDLMFSWRNHEDVRKYARNPEPFAIADHQKWCKALPKRPWIDLKMIEIEGLEPFGVSRLDFGPGRQRAEFTLYLSPQYHGKGLGIPAMRAILDYGFKTAPDLTVIWGDTRFDNWKAQKVFQGAGMWVNSGPEWVRYSIGREQWAKLPSLP